MRGKLNPNIGDMMKAKSHIIATMIMVVVIAGMVALGVGTVVAMRVGEPSGGSGQQPGNASATLSADRSGEASLPPICGTDSDYVYATTGGSIGCVGCSLEISECDGCGGTVALPFPYRLYGQTFNSVYVYSAGSAQFTSTNISTACMPNPAVNNAIIVGHGGFHTWDASEGSTAGISTGVSGNAPNRIFHISWEGCVDYESGQFRVCNWGTGVYFQLHLFEGQDRFDVESGPWCGTRCSGLGKGIAVQRGTGSQWTQTQCGTSQPPTHLTFYQPICPTAVPTNPPTITPPPIDTLVPTNPPTVTPTCAVLTAWSAVAPLPTAVYGAAVATDGEVVYAAGGYSTQTGAESSQFVSFDPGTNVWSPKATMPVPADSAAAVYAQVASNRYVYVFGGINGSGSVLTNTRIYDVNYNSWSAGAPMPGPRQLMGIGYYNGKIYAVGGYTNTLVTTAQAQTWEYNIASNTWLTKTAMPQALGGPGYGVINVSGTRRLYIAGGRNSSGATLRTLYEYNIDSDQWSARANLPSPVNAPASALLIGDLYNKLLLFGGGSPYLGPNVGPPKSRAPGAPHVPNTTNAAVVYDPATNSWGYERPLEMTRSFVGGAGPVGANSYVIAVGGYDGSSSMNTVEEARNCIEPTPTATRTDTATPTITATPIGGPYTSEWHAKESGAGAVSTDGNYTNSSTIGQSQAGTVSDGSYTNYSGFWSARRLAPTLTVTPTTTPTQSNTPTVTPTAAGYANTTPVTIPDGGSITSTIVIGGGLNPSTISLVTELSVVDMTITHPSASDLNAYLISPSGTRIELFEGVCPASGWTASTTGFTLYDSAIADIGSPGSCPPNTATYRPQGALSTLIGEQATGTWSLEVTDSQTGNTGTLNSWGLSITTCVVCPTTTPTRTSTSTETPTITPTFVSCSGPITDDLTGALTQTGRLTRDQVSSNCAFTKSYPGAFNILATIRYKTYIYNNTNTSPVCATINVETAACGATLHSSAYTGNYEPSDPSFNYLGDAGASGSSMTYSVVLPALTNLVVVINEAGENTCTGTYTVRVNGVNNNCPAYTPTITPTPTVTNTPICSTSAWTSQAPYPITILDQALASHGGKLYSFSGISNGHFTADAYMYDPDTNIWTAIASLPASRENASAVSDGTYIYIMGGSDPTGVHSTTNYRYDPIADTYNTMAPLSLGVRAAVAAYLGGQVYRIGGIGAGGVYTNTAETYSVSSNTWAPITNYPHSVGYLYAATINGSIYTAGGTGTTDTASTYRYNAGSNTWADADIANLPATRWGGISGVLNGHWVIAGGYAANSITNDARAWDPATNTWHTLDAMLQPRLRGLGGIAGDALYSVGGTTGALDFTGTNSTMRYGAACLNTVTPTPTRAPIIVGHVVWQGRPAQPHALQQLPITLTIKVGTSEINYPVQTTNVSGFFTVPVGSLANGTYNWRTKGPKYLANRGSLILIGAQITNLEIGQMKAGDANNDNVVNINDFNILRGTFGKSIGQPGYDDRADFTGDQIVSASDFNLLRGNFGIGGGPPIDPTGKGGP